MSQSFLIKQDISEKTDIHNIYNIQVQGMKSKMRFQHAYMTYARDLWQQDKLPYLIGFSLHLYFTRPNIYVKSTKFLCPWVSHYVLPRSLAMMVQKPSAMTRCVDGTTLQQNMETFPREINVLGCSLTITWITAINLKFALYMYSEFHSSHETCFQYLRCNFESLRLFMIDSILLNNKVSIHLLTCNEKLTTSNQCLLP